MTTKYSIKKLKNGLRYLFVHRPEMQTVTTMVLVATGSEFEAKEQNGLSHFLEHMCFKGTEKRPSSLVIDREFESMGADYNAFTSAEYTGYYAKGQTSDASTLLEICSDIFLNSTFPEAEIVKEKGVVIEEINMYEDDPKSKVHSVLDELLYGDQPAGRLISGTKETVSKFTRDDLVKYHRAHYTPSNSLVVIAGNFNKVKIAKQIERDFSKLAKKTAPKQIETIVDQKQPAIKVFFKESEQAHILLAFHAFNRTDKKSKIVRMVSGILGSGMASRLTHRLRGELGLCYYIGSHASSGNDLGTFYVSAGLAKDRLEEALQEIVIQLNKIKNELLSKEELMRVKKKFSASMRLALETSDSYADYYGFQELHGLKIKEIEEKIAIFEAITDRQIQNIAKQIFTSNNANLAIVGPYKKQDNLMKILRAL